MKTSTCSATLHTILLPTCGSRKYPYPPPRRAIGNFKGGEGLKSQIFSKQSMYHNWNFQQERRGRSNITHLSREGLDIF